jgi:hypothetical protein
MSRGPGRIELAIETAFKRHPKQSFTTNELVLAAYPQLSQSNRIEKKHRVAVLRAATHVCNRLGWAGYYINKPGNMVLFVNTLDLDAYVQGQVRVRRPFLSVNELAQFIQEQDENNSAWADALQRWKREHEISVSQWSGEAR